MHVVVGGAFNGKRKWVKKFYALDDTASYQWFCGYDEQIHIADLFHTKQFEKITIIEGIEQYIFQIMNQFAEWWNYWDMMVEAWRGWEKEGKGTIVVIGNDITKGIVPVDQQERLWRDACGFCFQDLVKKADRFDIIWYGLNERLK